MKFKKNIEQVNGIFVVPKLGFEYCALEPIMSNSTLEIHITKHHKNYVDNLNKLLFQYQSLISDRNAEEIIEYANSFEQKSSLLTNVFKNNKQKAEYFRKDILFQLKSNAGGHLNHSMFWEMITPNDTNISQSLLKKINESFGSFSLFTEEFIKAGMKRVGSGWIWLVSDKGQEIKNGNLKVISTLNQEHPSTYNYSPIICCDIWEHAYYLQYTYDRRTYIEKFMELINWQLANELYEEIEQA